jgi:HSP20 family molecular chaperone IbpA
VRYRRLGYRYTMIHRGSWPVMPTPWSGDVLNLLLGRAHWRPDADVCETALAVEIVVDLAGVEEDDLEVQLFEDALVVEGRRQPPVCKPETVYHAAGIRQGPFRLELPLPARVDASDVEARYERGLLRITIRKQEGQP